jgi:hypothetical protein
MHLFDDLVPPPNSAAIPLPTRFFRRGFRCRSTRPKATKPLIGRGLLWWPGAFQGEKAHFSLLLGNAACASPVRLAFSVAANFAPAHAF